MIPFDTMVPPSPLPAEDFKQLGAVAFAVEGKPVPWPRPAQRGRRRFVTPEAHEARSAVALFAIKALGRERAKWPMDARYSVAVTFSGSTGDVDNIAKLVLDALTAVLWNDDRRVDALRVERRWEPRKYTAIRVDAYRPRVADDVP